MSDFKQGVLSVSSVYYFAVANKVVFYDIGRAARVGGRLEEYFMHEC